MRTTDTKNTATAAKSTPQHGNQPFFQQEGAGFFSEGSAGANFFQPQLSGTPGIPGQPAPSPIIQAKCSDCEKEEKLQKQEEETPSQTGPSFEPKIQRAPDDITALRNDDAEEWNKRAEQFEKEKKYGDFAYALRMVLLLTSLDDSGMAKADDYKALAADMEEVATDEERTLNQFQGTNRAFDLYHNANAFPVIWSKMIYDALFIDIDLSVLAKDAHDSWKTVQAIGLDVPAAILETGLPVPVDKANNLHNYDLMTAFLSTKSHKVVDFARAGRIFTTKQFGLSFYTLWNKMAEKLRDAIADGSQTIVPTDYDDFMKNKRKGVRELSDFLGTATNESAYGRANDQVQDLRGLALLSGLGSMLGGLGMAIGYWKQVKDLFAKSLSATDAQIQGMDRFDRMVHGVLWAISNDYFGPMLGPLWEAIKENKWKILRDLVIFVVVQFIPGLNIAVDLVVTIQAGLGALETLFIIAEAFVNMGKAETTVDLQRTSARMGTAVTNNGVQLMIDLIGFLLGAKGLKAKMDAIKAVNPKISTEDAFKQAAEKTKLNGRVAGTVERSLLLQESLEMTQKLGNMTPETIEALSKNPGLKAALFENKIAAYLLKKCASPCFPPNATAKQVQRLQRMMERAQALKITMDPEKLREFFHGNRESLNSALDKLEKHLKQLEETHADKLERATEPKSPFDDNVAEDGLRTETPTGTRTARDAPGLPVGGLGLPRLGRNWLSRGISQIPGQIAEKMRNMVFKSFDDFRETFWKLVHQDPELSLSPEMLGGRNPEIISRGGAPFTRSADAVGKGVNARFQLDHTTPLEIGGHTYNLDELNVVVPRIHQALGH